MVKRKSPFFRTISVLLALAFFASSLQPVGAQTVALLPPEQNRILGPSIPFSFPVLRGMRVYPSKPFEFDFVVDGGDRRAIDQKETSLLIKYFLTFLTVPEEDLWVNLSPYESGRIIPDELALTDAGNILLLQDKLLKQLSSSLSYPETRLGREFWKEVYRKTYKKYGTTDLAVNTYNKVWIVPDKAVVYDMGDSALVGQTHLKVMLEEDYLALKKNTRKLDNDRRDLHTFTSEVTRQIILPELEKEVNEGKNFAPVRQMFHSLVLADWFKRALKRNVLSDFYIDKKKISGVDGVDKSAKEKIYKQYLLFFKRGAYNYIREDVDPVSQKIVPRKYFSGGCSFGDSAMWVKTLRVPRGLDQIKSYIPAHGSSFWGVAHVQLNPIGRPAAGDFSQTVRPASLRRFALMVASALMLLSAPGNGKAQAQNQEYAKNQVLASLLPGQSAAAPPHKARVKQHAKKTAAPQVPVKNVIQAPAPVQVPAAVSTVRSPANSQLAAALVSSSTSARKRALNDLMASQDGRLVVLDIYRKSSDRKLLELIEAQLWLDYIQNDAKTIQNPADNSIIFDALIKMHQRTKRLELLDVRLNSYLTWGLGILAAVAMMAGLFSKIYRFFLWRKATTGELISDLDKTVFYVDYLPEMNNKGQTMINIFGILDKSRIMEVGGQALLKELVNKRLVKEVSSRSVYVYPDLDEKVEEITQGAEIWPVLKRSFSGKKVYSAILPPLVTWGELVNKWNKTTVIEPQELILDMNTILNNTFKILRLMAYGPKLMWDYRKQPLNQDYQTSYYTFLSLANHTLEILNERLQNMSLTEIQRLRLLQDKDALLENMRYVSQYLRILKYRATIDKVMSYKFADDSKLDGWKEMHGWGPYVWVRWILLYQILWKKSEANLKKELPALLYRGNLIIPGMYNNSAALLKESEARLKKVTSGGETLSNTLPVNEARQHKNRSFIGATFSALLPVLTTMVPIILQYFGLAGFVIATRMFNIFIIILTYVNAWYPHLNGLNMLWSQRINRVIDQLDGRLNSRLDVAGEYQNGKTKEDKIIELTKMEGKKEIEVELSGNSPRVDAIVFISDTENDTAVLQQYAEGLRGRLIRKDIPVEVIGRTYKGSANAYLDALLKVKEKFETGAYKDRYPALKSWKDARVLFIFNRRNNAASNSLLDWNIANGYRMASSMSEAGHIIVNTRDLYFGPLEHIPPGGGITIMTSRVNGGEDLKNSNWAHTDIYKGRPQVLEILGNMNIQSLEETAAVAPRPPRTLSFLRDQKYHLSNKQLKQFSILNGMFVFGPDAVALTSIIAEKQSGNSHKDKLNIHLTPDIIDILLKSINLNGGDWNQVVDKHLANRARWSDNGGNGTNEDKIKDIKDALREFYGMVAAAVKAVPVRINAWVPHPGAELIIKNIHENGHSTETQRILALLENHDTATEADKASLAARTDKKGGIDLAFQPQFIQRHQQAGLQPIGQEERPLLPEGFTGFNFNIVRFKSQLTVNGAFGLMFNSDSGFNLSGPG
jgi:hypothetical protein